MEQTQGVEDEEVTPLAIEGIRIRRIAFCLNSMSFLGFSLHRD